MEKLFVAIVIALMLGSGYLFVTRTTTSANNTWKSSEFLQNALEFIRTIATSKPEMYVIDNIDSSPTSTSPKSKNEGRPASPKPGIEGPASPTQKPKVPAPTKQCNRAVVIHLDGSTSNRCYSSTDASQINSLRSQYSSAETFYQFHLDGVARYQSEYELTGSSIYLNAKASSQSSADREKAKMDAAVGAMQQIEARGW